MLILGKLLQEVAEGKGVRGIDSNNPSFHSQLENKSQKKGKAPKRKQRN